ncbi:hypothetical protein AB0H76_09010 [Nocardia sp. NPDC050712]|uniref:hypothetical protein n=1 Tax=Nocardia sp. NPDC050712 TaxID=3155518 RepID=UPI0033C3B1C1
MSTSFRISDSASRQLVSRAVREGTSSTALLNRLIREGVDQLEHPGIVFRGPVHDRRAALAAGPEVWEVVARLLELDGPMEQRIVVLAHRSDLPDRKIRAAVSYAREHGGEIWERIGRHRRSSELARQT